MSGLTTMYSRTVKSKYGPKGTYWYIRYRQRNFKISVFHYPGMNFVYSTDRNLRKRIRDLPGQSNLPGFPVCREHSLTGIRQRYPIRHTESFPQKTPAKHHVQGYTRFQ